MYQLLKEQTIWPIIGVVLFFTVFVLILVWTFSLDKKDIEKFKTMPLSDHKKTR